jgi:CHASE2 domain-containing sensor protein
VPVVLVAVDDAALRDMNDRLPGPGWPWLRDVWAETLRHLEKAGARAVVLDLTFSGPSQYEHEFSDVVRLTLADNSDGAANNLVFGVLYDARPKRNRRPAGISSSRPGC